MYKVCLSMIVKNERHVIKRCFDSVKDIIDYWIIVDTGSTDGTQDYVRSLMADLPGELHERDWVDFATNRNQGLELARSKADYTIIIDADEILKCASDFNWSQLKGQPGFSLDINFDGFLYRRHQIINNGYNWRYEGVLHEYLVNPTDMPIPVYPGLSIKVFPDGARSQDPNKYRNDIKVLKNALKHEPNNDRYHFYLAQSYRDAGKLNKAIKWYKKTVKKNGWYQEKFFALLQIAIIRQKQGAEWPEVMSAYLAAYEHNPDRVEPLYAITLHYLHVKEDYHTAFIFARSAYEKQLDLDYLFVEPALYKWEVPMVYAICCDKLGLRHEAVATYDRLLASSDLTKEQRAEVVKSRAQG